MTRLLQDVPDTYAVPSTGPPAAVTRPISSQLLERRSELARIESALAEARAGRGTFVVVEGPAGIGKTASWRRRGRRPSTAACGSFAPRGTELEHEFAFGVVRQLFEPLLAEAGEPERAELLHAAAGVAAGLLGLPGGQGS